MSDSKFIGDIKYIVCYLNNIKKDSIIYIFDYSAYLLKMDSGIPINKYDLVNNGNMGYKGAKRYIEEIDNYCLNNKCIFLLNKDLLNNGHTQVNRDILRYVVGNYKYKEELAFLDVYEN